MTKKAFTTETTAAAELFNATPAPAPATAPAPAADQARRAPTRRTPARTAPAKPAAAPTTTATAPVFTWKARPDGEKRDRRLQIICKPSVAQKAAELARRRGISVAYLFEQLIIEKWETDTPQA